jgi:hypothetical protein
MIRRTARALAALAVCAPLVLASAGTAAADPSPTPTPPPSVSSTSTRGTQPSAATWGVRPATDAGPDDRPNFTFGATRRSVINDHIAVTNVGVQPVTLRLYASDAFNNRDGGFDLLPAATVPVDVGSWVTLGQSQITIAARATAIVPFRLAVPANATPGDHVGGIVASLSTVATDAHGATVTVDQRVGTRIYLRVTGLLRPALTVEGLTSTYHPSLNPLAPSRVTIGYQIRNSGNVRLSGTQSLTVTTLWGQHISVPVLPDVAELLPGNTYVVRVEVTGIPAGGLMHAQVRLTPQAVRGDAQNGLIPTERTAWFWVLPWIPLLVLLIIAIIVYLVVRQLRRTRPQAG